MTANSRKPSEIEAEIEAERTKLSRDLETLQDRMTVENLVDDVKMQVKGQIDDLQRQLRGQLFEVTGAVGSEVRTQLSRTSAGLVRTTRDNPWPVLVTGVGLAWLAVSTLRPKPKRSIGYAPIKQDRTRKVASTYDYDPADMAATELEEDAGTWAREVVDANATPIPPYDARPTWARDDDELTTKRR